MLPVFLVNLDRSPDRLAAMTARLDRLGIPFERLPAVDGRALSPEDAARNRPPRFVPDLTPGEMGCFGSHRRFWSLVVERGLPAAVVLEDDILVDETFAEAIAALEPALDRHGFVRLMLIRRPRSITLERIGRFAIEEPLGHSRRSGTQGYVVTAATAAELLAASEKWSHAIDNFLDRSWIHGVPARHIAPPVLAMDEAFESEIKAMAAPKPHRHRSTIERIGREVARTLDLLQWAWWALRKLPPTLLAAVRRKTPVGL